MHVVFCEYVQTTGRISAIHRSIPDTSVIFTTYVSEDLKTDSFFSDKHVCLESGAVLTYSQEDLDALAIDIDLVIEADNYVTEEFLNYDIQINKHERNSPSKIGTLQQWYDYGIALENYVQVVDNIRTIMTAKPIRPTGA